jgi:NitT/TauT family transport system substrate-binding protein
MRSLRARAPRRLALAAWLVMAGGLGLAVAGCGRSGGEGAGGPIQLKVAYLGLTCEGPIFSAFEKGFFKEEGLEVQLVRTDWNGLREGLGLGRYDANHTLIMYLLKPLEQGLDVKITGGIHIGCLRLQAGAKTNIRKVTDLRGKKIGVPTHIGSPPYLFACRALAAHGIDPRIEASQVEWVAMKPDVLGLAVDRGDVDAVATTDPIGTILLGKKLVRTLADQAVDRPYCDEFCCVAVVSGKLARENPAAAAKVTRALLKGARWVGENPRAAARMGVEKKYIAASLAINEQAISKLKYRPGVASCRDDILRAAKEMKEAGLLKPTTNPERLARRAWQDLDGVTDEWIRGLKVEHVPGGGRARLLDPTQFAALFEANRDCSCCCKCCIDR